MKNSAKPFQDLGMLGVSRVNKVPLSRSYLAVWFCYLGVGVEAMGSSCARDSRLSEPLGTLFGCGPRNDSQVPLETVEKQEVGWGLCEVFEGADKV